MAYANGELDVYDFFKSIRRNEPQYDTLEKFTTVCLQKISEYVEGLEKSGPPNYSAQFLKEYHEKQASLKNTITQVYQYEGANRDYTPIVPVPTPKAGPKVVLISGPIAQVRQEYENLLSQNIEIISTNLTAQSTVGTYAFLVAYK